MSLVRTLRILASQRPSLPPRSVADPSRVRRVRHDHVPVTWIDPELASTATIVHLHGGAYVQGESRQTWEWLEEVARRELRQWLQPVDTREPDAVADNAV